MESMILGGLFGVVFRAWADHYWKKRKDTIPPTIFSYTFAIIGGVFGGFLGHYSRLLQ